MKRITICPRCEKPVEARDYMNPGIAGMLESVLPVINHSCGYRGLPITISIEGDTMNEVLCPSCKKKITETKLSEDEFIKSSPIIITHPCGYHGPAIIKKK